MWDFVMLIMLIILLGVIAILIWWHKRKINECITKKYEYQNIITKYKQLTIIESEKLLKKELDFESKLLEKELDFESQLLKKDQAFESANVSMAIAQKYIQELNALLAKNKLEIDTLKRTIISVMHIARSHPNIITDNSNQFVISPCKYGNFKLDIFDIHVSRSMLFYGEWMDDEISLIGKLVGAGDVVFDVGANIGTHTIPFAKFVGPHGKVLSFEPHPNIVKTLMYNVRLNALDNVEIIPKVVCESNDYHFNVNLEDSEVLKGNQAGISFVGGEKSYGNIPSTCLDQFTHLSPRLLKFDVEQMQINVLKGARKLITDLRPIIYMENHEKQYSAALLREMFNLQYDCYWHLVPAFNPDNYLKLKQDIWSGKGHCINMLCLPTEKNIHLSGLIKIESEEEWITDRINIDFSEDSPQDFLQFRIPVESIKGLEFV